MDVWIKIQFCASLCLVLADETIRLMHLYDVLHHSMYLFYSKIYYVSGSSRAKKLEDNLNKLNKFETMSSKKQQQWNEMPTHERSGGSTLKIGSLMHRSMAEFGSQKFDDRPKNGGLNKRLRTSVAETRVLTALIIYLYSAFAHSQHHFVLVMLRFCFLILTFFMSIWYWKRHSRYALLNMDLARPSSRNKCFLIAFNNNATCTHVYIEYRQ